MQASTFSGVTTIYKPNFFHKHFRFYIFFSLYQLNFPESMTPNYHKAIKLNTVSEGQMKWTFLSFHPEDKSCGYTLRVPKTYVYMEKVLVVIYFSVVFLLLLLL